MGPKQSGIPHQSAATPQADRYGTGEWQASISKMCGCAIVRNPVRMIRSEGSLDCAELRERIRARLKDVDHDSALTCSRAHRKRSFEGRAVRMQGRPPDGWL